MSGESGKYHQTVTDQTSLQASSRAVRDIDWYFEKGFKHQKLFINIHGTLWQKSKDKEFSWLFWNKFSVSDFTTLTFPPTCQALKTWFELSRAKLYRKNLRGNKNYFELAGGSSYRG